MNRHPQIPLSLDDTQQFSFQHFDPAGNEQVVSYLQQFAAQTENRWPSIIGQKGFGKTHLLHALVRKFGAGSAVIDLADPALEANQLHYFSNYQLLAIDNIHHGFGHPEWEEALFHLFNQLRQNQNQLAMSMEFGLQQYKIGLPDLLSRLKWGVTLELKAMNTEALINFMYILAERYHMVLSEQVIQFMINHCQRNAGEVALRVSQLAELSLSRQKRPSVPMLQTLLKNK